MASNDLLQTSNLLNLNEKKNSEEIKICLPIPYISLCNVSESLYKRYFLAPAQYHLE